MGSDESLAKASTHTLRQRLTTARQGTAAAGGSLAEPVPPVLHKLLADRYGERYESMRSSTGAVGSDLLLGGGGRQSGRAAAKAKAIADQAVTSLPVASLAFEPTWVDTPEAVTRVHEELARRAAAAVAAGKRLVVGADTEWADAVPDDAEPQEQAAVATTTAETRADGHKAAALLSATGTAQSESRSTRGRRRRGGPPPRVATVQLAVDGHAWVIDSLAPGTGAVVGKLLRWLLENDEAFVFLGYAFRGDLAVLRALCGEGVDACALVDLQDLARLPGEDTPSLRRVAARVVGVRLDKSEQCSNWARRPLTHAQFLYAALDAHILLDVYAALTHANGMSTRMGGTSAGSAGSTLGQVACAEQANERQPSDNALLVGKRQCGDCEQDQEELVPA